MGASYFSTITQNGGRRKEKAIMVNEGLLFVPTMNFESTFFETK
jgi:hypothetical protein